MANNKKIPGKAFDGHLSLPLPLPTTPIPKKEKNNLSKVSDEKGKGGKEKPKKG